MAAVRTELLQVAHEVGLLMQEFHQGLLMRLLLLLDRELLLFALEARGLVALGELRRPWRTLLEVCGLQFYKMI